MEDSIKNDLERGAKKPQLLAGVPRFGLTNIRKTNGRRILK